MRLRPAQCLTTLLLLLAYAITGTSVLPAAIALAARLDGSHVVSVSESPHGTRVTLHHTQESGYTPFVADHRSALARLIVSLSHRSSQGDHQIVSAQCDKGPSLQRRIATGEPRQAHAAAGTPPAPHLLRRDLFARGHRTSLPPGIPEHLRPHALRLIEGVQQLI